MILILLAILISSCSPKDHCLNSHGTWLEESEHSNGQCLREEDYPKEESR